MKRRLIIASAVLALLSTALCGCTESAPAAPLPETSEPAGSVSIADEKSEPESLPESTIESSPESSVENTSEITSESEPQNAASYTVTKTSYEDGKLNNVVISAYDEHGSLIRQNAKYGNSYAFTYDYNDDGTVRETRCSDYREEYEYENGLEIKRTKYASGRVVSVMTHTYDEHGNEVAMTYDILGSVDSYTCEFTYDENGVWTKELIYNADGGLRGTYTRVLGENGEELSGRLEEENSVFTYEYKYDEDGREVELHTAYALGGAVVGETRVVTEYDEQGRVSRKEEYRLDGGERLASTEEYDYKISAL
ncbi:MAG: hypothetical protein K2J77_01150 [Oscillospiraceae bacterium]|nr:hypothetical protein [Oscillospiraceae bacterium]